MSIYIFGDSYFEEDQLYRANVHWKRDETSMNVFTQGNFKDLRKHLYHGADKTWMSMLRKSYASEKIENYGQSGAGPHYNLPLICDMILDKKITSDDILICHISGVTRVNFPWENNKTINEVSWDHNSKKSFCYEGELEGRKKKVQNFYNVFQHEIDFTYLTFDKFLQISGFLMVEFLHSISKTKNIKVLVFGNTQNGNQKNEIRVSPFNDKNFHLSKFDLFEISTREIFFGEVDNWDRLYPLHDERYNHLSAENHEIFFEYVNQFISRGFIDTTLKFKENFKHANEVYKVINEQHSFKEKFIYD